MNKQNTICYPDQSEGFRSFGKPQDDNSRYMQMAIAIAKKAGDKTHPNPLVGAVIVSEHGEIIGKGYHIAYGRPHAEVEAINSVKEENKTKLKDSTLFVNLEPCCHQGKTPPCVDAVLAAGIRKVVIANVDCNPNVCGQGIEILKKNGVEIVIGVLEKEARLLNKRFFERFE